MKEYPGEYLRATILGRMKWHRCQECSATGFKNWAEDGTDVKPGPSASYDRCNGTCKNCDGLGFVKATS